MEHKVKTEGYISNTKQSRAKGMNTFDVEEKPVENKKMYTMLPFYVAGDNRGSLIALEHQKNIPFPIERVYYIFETQEGVHRGKHAHLDLEQVIVCLAGKCTFLVDNGTVQEELELSSPAEGLYISGGIWREMYNFSKECVLLVLASKKYDENDYIRDYKDFLALYGRG